MKSVKVTWEIDDGYVGRRPRTFYISHDEWEGCETQQEKDELVEALMEFEFHNNIAFYVTRVEDYTND